MLMNSIPDECWMSCRRMLMIITPIDMSRIVCGRIMDIVSRRRSIVSRRRSIVISKRRSIVAGRRRSIVAGSRMVGGRRGMMAGRLKIWGSRMIRMIDIRIRIS